MQSKLFGVTCLVAGTTIGAGMLALPLTLGVFSLPVALGILFLGWIFMYIAGRLNLNMLEQAGQGASLAVISSQYFPRVVPRVIFGTLVVFLMSLLTAYLSGATSLILSLLGEARLAEPLVVTGLTVALAVLMSSHHDVVDFVNRALFVVMVAIFFVMVGRLMAPSLASGTVVAAQGAGLSLPTLTLAIPVVITAFGCHLSLPSFLKFANNDLATLRRGFFWGLLLALILYAAWVVGCVAILKDPLLKEKLYAGHLTLGELTKAISLLTQAGWFMVATWVFSLLAVLTSFIGVSMALKELWAEALVRARHSWMRREFSLSMLTFALPLLICLMHSNIFTRALAAAGTYLTVIAVVIPVFIRWRQDQRQNALAPLRHQAVRLVLLLASALVVGAEVWSWGH